MHRNCLSLLYYVLCVSEFVLFTVICTTMITDVLGSTPTDLGFNNTTDDSCDYWDYSSELTADSNHVVVNTSGEIESAATQYTWSAG